MLVEYAKDELEKAGLFDKDSDYNGMIGDAVMELMGVFAKQGHSGFSAGMVIHLFGELASFKPITPLEFTPDEFMDISEMSGTPMWQNKRKPTVFSTEVGKTWYDLDEPGRPVHQLAV